MIVRVLPDQALDSPLDYLVPPDFEDRVDIGSRVLVPIKNRIVPATVLDVPAESPFPRLRAIAGLLSEKPLINPVLLRMARWVANYYCCREEIALRCVLPRVIRKAEVGHRMVCAVEPARPIAPAEADALAARAPKQAALLRLLLEKQGPVSLKEITKHLGACASAVEALVKRGVLRRVELKIERDPHAGETFLPSAPLALNAEQQVALDRVIAAVRDPTAHKPLLLYGVTGSGKTEVYLQAIAATLDLGKSALVLVPEIALTPQTVERFKSRFASIQREVAVLHSHLSDGERHDEWHRIHSGAARIVIGVRSAVFAPLANPGLIIVDEEHEPSYKQEEVPKYNARDLAVLRGSLEPCAVLLGSATPSLESFRNTQTGKYELLELHERADNRSLPVIRILDMRVMRRGKRAESILAAPLEQAIRDRLEKREQTILFLNRRGYSTSLLCQACGHVCQCPNCSVALTFHRDAGRLVCHICGYTSRAPSVCPSCSNPGIRHSGVGTQKVEEAVAKLFPEARVARMDADAMTRKDSYRELLGKFRKGQIDILVGTQMIAKGLHFPNVTLVGIVNADLGLHLPDFRAGERVFQLLMQVAGRAGRGEMLGEVMVQTFTPFAAAIQFARHHDYRGFMEQEMEFRERFHYPPFSRMVLIQLRSHRENLAEFTAQTLHRRLAENLPPGSLLGAPGPAPLAKAKGQFRFHISLRAPRSTPLVPYIRSVLERLPPPDEVFVTVDVDPYQLL
jgi:primosomal protein N' (replication factor Y)